MNVYLGFMPPIILQTLLFENSPQIAIVHGHIGKELIFFYLNVPELTEYNANFMFHRIRH